MVALASFLATAALSGMCAASATSRMGTTELASRQAAAAGCDALKAKFPSKTFLPGDAVYVFEVNNLWSNTQILTPSCVFRPESAGDVSAAILTSKSSGTPFSVRGGGHMGVKGANSIDDGIMIVMSSLTTLAISADRTSVDVGPSHRWGDVYTYLSQFNRGAAGGRLSPVGVAGLLLGGGISYYGNQHGWSADNVLEYEVVLASGKIVTVSDCKNADLFWALKGGSSNFGIVTKFKLRTFPSTKVFAGAYTVGDIPAFLDAVANYSAFNTDPLSHIVPMVVPVDASTTIASVVMFYDSETESNPACFEPFLSIPAISSTLDFKTLAAFAVEIGGLVVDHISDVFFAGTALGNTFEELQQGVRITNDVFFAELPKLYAVIPIENLSLVSIDWQPLGDLWAAGSKASNPIGNALGFDPATKGMYLSWAGVVEWTGSGFEEVVMAWVETTTNAINDAVKAAGLFDPFNYMGDAAGFQEIYPGYGAANQKQLLDISRKYDPQRVFQNLMPGGFKIGA